MKAHLFESQALSEEEMIENLEQECFKTEDGFFYVKVFTEEEAEEVKQQHLDFCKEIAELKAKLKTLSDPIKSQIKSFDNQAKELIDAINRGGHLVTNTVYCFPDHENGIMGLYDCNGHLVGTRPITVNDNQLYIK